MSNRKQIKRRNKFISKNIDSNVETSCIDCVDAFCCKHTVDIDVMSHEWEIIKPLITEEHIIKMKSELMTKQLTGYFTCPFLINNRCSIYDYRPFACSSHYVISPRQQCDTINNYGGDIGYLDKTEIFSIVLNRKLVDIRDISSNDLSDLMSKYIKNL